MMKEHFLPFILIYVTYFNPYRDIRFSDQNGIESILLILSNLLRILWKVRK